jgi:tetratricopeptide (TPR) repeat protein
VGIHEIHPVDEFRPIAWAWDAPLVLHLAACGVAALLLARSGRAPWRQVLPAALLAALAARSVRFGAEAALALAPLGAAGLTALAPRLPGGGAAAPLPLGVALVAAALAPRIAAARAGGPLLDVGLREAALPLAALRFVDEAGLRDRMYNDFEIGGYLAWSGWPRHRVFVDPRLPAYPLEFHRLLGRADLDRATWDAALAGHGVDAALLGDAGVNRRVAWWDPARWALVYRAEDARVFVRRGPRHRAVIAAREIPATFAFTDAEGTRTLPILAPPPGSPVPACEWELRLGDLYFDLDGGGSERAIEAAVRALAHPRGCLAPAREAAAAAWVGALLRERGDPAAALALLDRAVEHAPGDPATLVNRALALEALGRRGEARGAWEAVAGATRDADLAARARARAAAPRP